MEPGLIEQVCAQAQAHKRGGSLLQQVRTLRAEAENSQQLF